MKLALIVAALAIHAAAPKCPAVYRFMKLALIAYALAFHAAAQTPECTYTLIASRPGALAVFRNGTLLNQADYTRSGSLGRTITLKGWNDKDQITYSYPYAANVLIPGTVKAIQIWISTLEYHTCTGTQNPPPVSVKVARQQCVGASSPGVADTCAGIELWTITAGDTTRQFAAVPATSQLAALPACSDQITNGCLKDATLQDAPLQTAQVLILYAAELLPQ